MNMARSSYTLEDALASGEAARQAYADTAAERNRRVQEAYDLEAQAAEKEAREQERNWGSTALQGTARGSTFGPWGALAGGILGTVAGQARAVKSQLDEGGRDWDKTKRVANQLFGWGIVEPWTKAETYTGAVGMGQKLKTPLLAEKTDGMRSGGAYGGGGYGSALSPGELSMDTYSGYGGEYADASDAGLAASTGVGGAGSGDTYGADLGGGSELAPLSVSLGWDDEDEEE
jgi:hypothetical protein